MKMEKGRGKGLQRSKKVECPDWERVKDVLEKDGRAPKKDPWSKSFLETQLRSARSGTKGLKASPVAPYVPLGTPNLKIHASSMPVKYQASTTYISKDGERNSFDDMSIDGECCLLPTRLRNCYWNGDRWCATMFKPRFASASNGYELLSQEIGKSQARLHACRKGKYFMSEVKISAKKEKQVDIDEESLKNITSMKPRIPRLNLSSIPDFESSEKFAKNAALLSSFQHEAKRLASTRSAGLSSREHNSVGKNEDGKESSNEPSAEQVFDGVPVKAIEEFSLFQLTKILDKDTIFSATQEELNQHLLKMFRASDSLRPFTLTRGYRTLQNMRPTQERRPSTSPKRAETFRSNLGRHCWYANLIASMFCLGRQPTRPEVMILCEIGHVIEKGLVFGGKEYCDLLLFLQKKDVDLNGFETRKALMGIRYTLQIPDEVISEGFVRKCGMVPDWLACIYVPKTYSRLTSRPCKLDLT
eukprot:Gb_37424 [translate_table: standard]